MHLSSWQKQHSWVLVGSKDGFILIALKAQAHTFMSRITSFHTPHHALSILFLSFFLFLWSQLLSEIEEHLKCTITQCEPDIKVPVDEFDGKVTYGQRRTLGGMCERMARGGKENRDGDWLHDSIVGIATETSRIIALIVMSIIALKGRHHSYWYSLWSLLLYGIWPRKLLLFPRW